VPSPLEYNVELRPAAGWGYLAQNCLASSIIAAGLLVGIGRQRCNLILTEKNSRFSFPASAVKKAWPF
jgi:hypothetical protein